MSVMYRMWIGKVLLLLVLTVRSAHSCCCGVAGAMGVGECPPDPMCCDKDQGCDRGGTPVPKNCDGKCFMDFKTPDQCRTTQRFLRKYTSFDSKGMTTKKRASVLRSSSSSSSSSSNDVDDELLSERAYGSTLNQAILSSSTGSEVSPEDDPYIMEFSILVCEGDEGCGSEGSMEEIDKFFEDQIGDWTEPERLLKWEAASPRETEDSTGAQDLGTPRVPTVLSEKKVSDIVEFFSEYLDVPEDLVFVRDYSKTINPDNGMVRLPLAVWLNGQDELVEANKLLRKLHDDPTELRKELGATVPHGSNSSWVWVDAWCPPAGGPADTPIGCQSLDLSDIQAAEQAVKIAGRGEPEHDFPRYPEQHDPVDLGTPFSMIVRAKDQRELDLE